MPRKSYYPAQKQKAQELRLAILDHYGSRCSCCGESQALFLCIDHVNNDGYTDRQLKQIELYQKIIKRGFPDSYRILCYNCNCGRERNGGVCPHLGVQILEYQPPIRTKAVIVKASILPLFD